MSRLPTVSGDGDAWGTILNDFLSVVHNADGTLKNRPINLKDYCAIDGVTDDSTGFTAAYTLAASLGVGLFLPGGTLVKGNDTLLSNVPIDLGGGTIKLKNGANTDLFSCQTGSINLSAAFGSGPVGTVLHYSISNGILDGNRANQSAGPSYCIRAYSYGFRMHNLLIWNGYSGDWVQDWNGANSLATTGTVDQMEAQISNVKVHDCNGIPVQFGGPLSSQFTNFMCFNGGSHLLHLAPNAPDCKFSNLHCYGPGQGNNSVGMLIEASNCQFANAQCEGSDTVNVAILANNVQWRGLTFGEGASAYLTDTGIQLGQTAGNTPYAGQVKQSGGLTTNVLPLGCIVDATIYNTLGNNGALWIAFDGGNNIVRAAVNLTAGKYITGTLDQSSLYEVLGRGLTPDGTVAKAGILQYPLQQGNGVWVATGPNGSMVVDQYSDISMQGQMSLRNINVISGSLQTLTNGSTITHTNDNLGLLPVTATANVTGIILATVSSGANYVMIVSNRSAFTITFAASGTSHVAGGTGIVIAANVSRQFVWDTSQSLWY